MLQEVTANKRDRVTADRHMSLLIGLEIVSAIFVRFRCKKNLKYDAVNKHLRRKSALVIAVHWTMDIGHVALDLHWTWTMPSIVSFNDVTAIFYSFACLSKLCV